MKDLFGNQPIRSLSWKEPFATLMLYGKVETRPWATKYRGLVLICASKKPYTSEEVRQLAGEVQHSRIMEGMDGIKTHEGHAIAVGELNDCRLMYPVDANKCFIEYNPDLNCHIYRNVRPIEPFPYKGAQGWRKLDSSIWEQIKFI